MKHHKPLVADTDVEFLMLRPDIRDMVRTAELGFRADIEAGFSKLEPPLRELLRPTMDETPARFIRTLLPFIAGYSELRDQAEAIKDLIEQAQRARAN